MRTEQLVAELPCDRPVALLLRHAARPERPDWLPGPDTPLSATGEQQARALGRKLAGRDLLIHTSPVLRCRVTAAAVAEQSHAPPPIDDVMLGGPGVFVIDEALAGMTWAQMGHARVLEHLCRGVGAWPGLADPVQASMALLRHVVSACDRKASGSLVLFVTHDSILGPTLYRWYAGAEVSWPAYLDAAALWRDEDRLCLRYTGLLAHLEQGIQDTGTTTV